jgi:SAM-dependent methyltransferase
MPAELVHVRTTCRCCGSPAIELSVPLAKVPIVSPNVDVTEKSVTTTVAPLDTYLCRECGLIQLVHVVDPSLIYRNYLYRTAISKGLAEHFGGLCDAAVSRLGLRPGCLVVEFGSNDGTLLNFFREKGMRVQGIDPAGAIAAEATARGIPTRADFFGERVANELASSVGKADLILSNNVMANIDELEDVIRGIKALLAPGGAYAFETQYALDVFEHTLIDVIYHEHISCFSVQPVVRAFARFGLEVFDAERIPTKGGSIRFWVQHAHGPQPVAPRVAELVKLENDSGLYDPAYHRRFGERVAEIKAKLHALIAQARAHGPIAAYGTSVGCAALIHQFGLEDKLDFMLDDTPFKQRIEGPGYDLPVHSGEAVQRLKPALIIVLAWRYAQPIMANHRKYIESGGRFVVPLPGVRVIE